MTATAPITRDASAAALHTPSSTSKDVVACLTSIGILLLAYLALQNPYWVPGGDSEVYTAIARNMVIGKGFTFNGLPVSMVPPGWPWFLALAMKVSPTFLFLKVLTMLCMLGSMLISYWICRRFASPGVSALVIVVTGLLSHVYALTFWLHSDALFCLASSASLLLAMQIAEKRPGIWRVILLMVLCGVNVLVRWAGIFSWLMVAAALISRFDSDSITEIPRSLESLKRWIARLRTEWLDAKRIWIIILISGFITGGTFFTLRWSLRVSKDVARMINAGGGNIGGDEGAPMPTSTADANLATQYSMFNPAQGGIRGLIGRFGNWGNWISFLFWQPFRLAQASHALNALSLVVGWLVLLPFLIHALLAAIQRQWVWSAAALYSLALAMNWPNANARYLVPIAPLLLLGIVKFLEIVTLRFPDARLAIAPRVVLGYLVASMLVCNGALYACDVWAARSSDFYSSYEAGLNEDLIAAAKWLGTHEVADGQIAVCERYVNLGRIRTSRLALRATTMLTGKAIVSVPMKYLRSGDPRRNPHFLNWARSDDVNVKYVLYQPEVSPWRVFHFRMGWLQEAMTGEPAIDSGAGWRLYAIPAYGDEADRISLEPAINWPKRVPGI